MPADSPQGPPPDLATITQVCEEESKDIARRRDEAFKDATPPEPPGQQRDPPGVPDDLVGVALSGGGIRSAMFNLGLLQALRASGLWRYVDYLSTVSGGRYLERPLEAAFCYLSGLLLNLIV